MDHYVCSKEEVDTKIEMVDPQLQSMCEGYADIFSEVIGLPPHRSHDHHIPLLPGAEPISQRSYRHPWEQKNTIEKMAEEMLDADIIKNNKSPYASPIVMVKKPDGSWRMC